MVSGTIRYKKKVNCKILKHRKLLPLFIVLIALYKQQVILLQNIHLKYNEISILVTLSLFLLISVKKHHL